jgi:tRNA (guanine37-N1)-methyltransferase
VIKITIITSNSSIFPGSLGVSIFQRAIANKKLLIQTIDLKNFTPQNNRMDDYPFGGGAGLVIKPEVAQLALDVFLNNCKNTNPIIISPSPKGIDFNNKIAKKLASLVEIKKEICFFCSRFEGVDQRFIEKNNVIETSLGNFILAGGDVAVMAICEAFLRFIPGILGNNKTHEEESFNINLTNISKTLVQNILFELINEGFFENTNPYSLYSLKDLQKTKLVILSAQQELEILIDKIMYFLSDQSNVVEYNHYTRPNLWNNISSPDTLLNGNHKEIYNFRQKQSVKNTIKKFLLS